MQLEGGKIDNLHLAFLIMGFTFGASVILTPGSGAEQDAWLTALAGLIIGLLLAFIFFSLAEKFPGKNLIEINNILFGPYLGKAISVLYIGYFFHLGSLVLRNFGDFLTIFVYLLTPEIVLVGLMALIAASAVRNGIEVIARCSIFLVPITIVAFIFNSILLLPQTEFERLLPFFKLPLKEFLKLSHATASFPFGESVSFLMLTASLTNPKNLKKFALGGLIIPGVFLTFIAARNTAVLGATAIIGLYPSFDTIQLINIWDVLTRLELIIISIMLTMGFLKLAVLYYGTVVGIAQLLNLRSYLPLVLPIGIIMVVISMMQFKSAQENIVWAQNIYPWYVLPFQFFLPLISLILALLKGKKGNKKKAGESA
jgi:spore germination protein KB